MKSADEIKKFFKSAAIDTNPKMDEAVLNKVLIANEKTTNPKSAAIVPNLRRTIMKNPITKIAAVLAVVLGLGALAVVGVNIGKIYYYGQNEEGSHIFYGEGVSGKGFITLDDDKVTDIEQTRRDLEEIELLRQQDKNELLKVEEIMMDGILQMKVHVYKYELSDGRIIDMREGVGGEYAYSKSQLEEFRQLKKAGQGEDLGTYEETVKGRVFSTHEETVKGRVFSFKREKYLLSDGTEAIWSVGTPK
jgi:molecular chaperone DnaK (HSP70)